MKLFLTTLALCAGIGLSVAQTTTDDASTTSEQTEEQPIFKKNVVKVNLSSLAFNNYSFSYERSISRKMTLAVGYATVPSTTLGDMAFTKKAADKYLEDGNDIKNNLDKFHLSNQAFTGELRMYAGKHAGARGFYVSAYGRYATTNFDYLDTYQPLVGEEIPLPYKGKLNSMGGGLMLGAQWLIAKKISFDWYIVGAHYGNTGGDITIKQDFSRLSEPEKRSIEAEVEERFTVGERRLIDATITNSGGHGKVDAPFAGIRGFGFNLGYAF